MVTGARTKGGRGEFIAELSDTEKELAILIQINRATDLNSSLLLLRS